MATTRLVTLEGTNGTTSFKGILNSRKTLNMSHVGEQVLLTIQGAGSYQSAADQAEADLKAGKPAAKAYFDKRIHNVKANSQEAMGRSELRMLLSEAIAEEKAGNLEKASEMYNMYLNSVQVSFNVIADRSHKFQDGEAITAFVGTAETKAGHRAIVINDVRYKAPTTVETVKFDISDLTDEPAVAHVAGVDPAAK